MPGPPFAMTWEKKLSLARVQTVPIPPFTLGDRVAPEGDLFPPSNYVARAPPPPTLPLRLPPGARLLALRVDGRDATGLVSMAELTAGAGPTIELPVPRSRSASSAVRRHHQYDV